jgi:hypothetical protein
MEIRHEKFFLVEENVEKIWNEIANVEKTLAYFQFQNLKQI